MNTALITGVSGQDGSILANFLIERGYKVYGLMRKTSDNSNILDLLDNENFSIIYGDLMNEDLLRYVLSNIKIGEIYNLASQSNVRFSYENARFTFEVTLMGTISLIEAVKKYSPQTKIFQAGSSSMFGRNCDSDGLQRETTSFNPISPYASSKLFAHNICQNYRENHNLYISNGILYNHESAKSKRNPGIIKTVVEKAVSIKYGTNEYLDIPDPSIRIDFSHAKDCVEAMWISLQQEKSDDYIISSGESRSIEEICFYVFDKLGLDHTKYMKTSNQKTQNSPSIGDPLKISSLGWKRNFTTEQMMDEMIDFELKKKLEN